MKKIEKEIAIEYKFDSSHKGAPYTLDGVHFKNGGEFTEIAIKDVLGYVAEKDANTPYDEGDDIPELNASVKSSRFTLTNRSLADTKEESIKAYFETTHSSLWLYGIIIENIVTIYFMNKSEFSEYLNCWTSLNERKVLRAKATSAKMIKWFEERV